MKRSTQSRTICRVTLPRRGLRGILTEAGETAELLACEVRAKGDGAWHDEPALLISVNHITAVSGNSPF